MSYRNSLRHRLLAGSLAAGISFTALAPSMAIAQSTPRPAAAQPNQANDLVLSVGRGRLVSLPTPMTDVFVANNVVADVQVRSSTQLYVFGKAPGETSVYATDASGRVVYSVVARVGNNIETIDQMLLLAMPDATINVNTMNGIVLLTGTVASPEDAAEADRLVSAFVGDSTRVISRLQTATPLQVNLQVKIAEVNRSIVKQIGGNLTSRDNNGNNFIFGAFRGRDAGSIADRVLPTAIFPANPNIPGSGLPVPVPYYPETGLPVNGPLPQEYTIRPLIDAATVATGGSLFGLNLLATLDLAERSGMVTTLAQPNLTTVSGETADFLAGGEYPIPVPDPSTGTITIQYRKFGVSLAYTPTVLSNGRISLRVRPEVSELSTEGAIRLNGIQVPALSIRRAETTVELGSGESFMIAGLMNNRTVGAIDSTPGLGNVPILGNLFRSDDFRRGDTELVIVVTPYLVRPVNANDIVLPTDGFQNPTDIQRLLLNRITDGQSGQARPMPTLEVAPDTPAGGPANGPGVVGMPAVQRPQSNNNRRGRDRDSNATAAVTPGFSFRQ